MFGPVSAPLFAICVYFCRFIILDKRVALDKAVLLISIFLMAYASLQCLFDNSWLPVVDNLKTVVIVIAIVSIFCEDKILSVRAVLLSFSVGLIWPAILSVLFGGGDLNAGARFALSDEGGQNVLGITCAVLAAALLSYSLIQVRSASMICLAILLMLIGILTQSRSFILGMLIGAVILFFGVLIKLSEKQLLKAIAMLLVVSMAVIIAAVLAPGLQDYATMAIDRIINPRGGDISNERFEIWGQYIQSFIANPSFVLFGTSDVSRYGFDIVAHNFVIEQLASHGIVGNAIVLLLYGRVLRLLAVKYRVKSLFSDKLISAAAIMVLFSSSMFSHTMLGLPQTMMLVVSAILLFSSCEIKANVVREVNG